MPTATEQRQAVRDRIFTFRATGPEREQLRKAAADRGLSVSDLLRQALTDAGVVLNPHEEGATP
jgi:uncharacterized protein (DUF1778 family)